jgi:hypothetical protein
VQTAHVTPEIRGQETKQNKEEEKKTGKRPTIQRRHPEFLWRLLG